MRTRLSAPETAFGFLLAALGAFLLATGGDIFSPVIWGPALTPRIVAWGLVVLGVATVLERIRAPVGPGLDAAAKDWRGFGWTLGAIVAFAVLVELAGFPVAAGILFALVARGFGSRRLGWDLLIGFALAGVVHGVFALGLGLQLSWGGMLETAFKGP